MNAEMTFKPGDRVLYLRQNSGWGGGETWHLIAIVEKVHRTRATISLWNERTQSKTTRCVKLSSLSARDFVHDIDKEPR